MIQSGDRIYDVMGDILIILGSYHDYTDTYIVYRERDSQEGIIEMSQLELITPVLQDVAGVYASEDDPSTYVYGIDSSPGSFYEDDLEEMQLEIDPDEMEKHQEPEQERESNTSLDPELEEYFRLLRKKVALRKIHPLYPEDADK